MILYDLALCIDNNNNEMTFVAPERSEGANDATRATNKLYAPQKSCVYPIYIIPTPTLPFFLRNFFFHSEKWNFSEKTMHVQYMDRLFKY